MSREAAKEPLAIRTAEGERGGDGHFPQMILGQYHFADVQTVVDDANIRDGHIHRSWAIDVPGSDQDALAA